jgi:hypothetical protein
MSISIIILENGSVYKKIQINDKNDVLYNLEQTILKVSSKPTTMFSVYYDIDVNDLLLIIEIINEFENKYSIMLVGLSKEENEHIKKQLLTNLNPET